jgi:hypothetical protein
MPTFTFPPSAEKRSSVCGRVAQCGAADLEVITTRSAAAKPDLPRAACDGWTRGIPRGMLAELSHFDPVNGFSLQGKSDMPNNGPQALPAKKHLAL